MFPDTALMHNISREAPILIAGPTASGKSALALALAARDGRIIVNADALQVYACWRVLSARPTYEEERAQPHALYGHVGDQTSYSVGHWLREVTPLMAQSARPVVIVGGTGLYFRALTEGLSAIPPIPQDIRAQGDALRRSDIAAMRGALDAQTAARIDLNNPARVQRAWEVLRSTGKGLEAWHRETPPPLLRACACTRIVLRPDVEWLNQRIAARFAQMMTQGALEEVMERVPNWDPSVPANKAIGAAELVAYLRGETTREAAIEAAIIATRQYAKRQRTWLRRRMKDWMNVGDDAG